MFWYLSVNKPVKALLKLERDDFDLISLEREFQNLVVDTEKERPPSVSLVKRRQTKLKSPCLLSLLCTPMNNTLGVSPSKGKQGPTRGKEKVF